MEQKYLLGILALAMVSVLGLSMISASGFGNGSFNGDLSDEDKEAMQQERDVMHDAIVDNDYDAWAELMQTRIERMQSEITPENFNSVVERYDEMSQVYELRQELKSAIDEGDDEAVEELRIQLQELMPEEPGNGFGMHAGESKGMKMHLHDGSCPD